MRTVYLVTYILLNLVFVSCTSPKPISTQISTPIKDIITTPATNIITSDNIHELVQLDYKNENGVSVDISISKGSMVTSVAFSPNGEILAAGYGIYTNDPSVYLYNVETGKQLAQLKTQFRIVHRVTFSPNGKLLAASGGYDPGMRGVQIWDTASQSPLLELNDFGDIVYDIAFSPDGANLATAEIGSWFGPGYVKMWSVPKGELLSKFPSEEDPWISAWSVAFNPSGTYLATNHAFCKQVIIWNVANPNEYKVLPKTIDEQCIGVAFSSDGRYLASRGVYDIDTGKLLFELTGGENNDWVVIPNVAFSPNSQVIASARNENVMLWDIRTGKYLETLPGYKTVVFSPDGTLIATGGDIIRLWGVPTD